MPKITRGSDLMGDRYKYDFKLCRPIDGWAQLDTRQDASYYGNWINPITLKLVSYCEGDLTLTECSGEADFVATLRECVAWHREREYFIGIDALRESPAAAAFIRMGFGDLLH